MPYLPSPGRCIYCLETEGLTDEHIVPKSFGGTHILRRASCKRCQRATTALEGVVARGMYWPLRLSLGLGSRKHKDRPKHWDGILTRDEEVSSVRIEVGKWPRNYAVLVFAPPGLIIGASPTHRSPEMTLQFKVDQPAIDALLSELNVGQITFEHTLDWAALGRMIAKICHAYAVSIVGLDGVEFYLPAIIRSDSDDIAHYVGGVGGRREELQPPRVLELEYRCIGDRDYLCARTNLLGQTRFPTCTAVVGRILDQNLVLARVASNNATT